MKYTVFKPREKDRFFLISVLNLTLKMLIFAVLLIGIAGSGILGGLAKAWIDTCPSLDLDAVSTVSQTSFIYDVNGNLITEFKGSENRIYVGIDEIPQQLINAVISIEDARFYEHHGIDLKRMVGALVNNFTGGNLQGASTITCQLVKLTLLNSDQNYKRKIQEAYLALQIEENLTKDQILEAYLNVIYLGGANYGIKIAARDYFGKDLEDLTLRECACLAAIIRNPYRYNPRRNYYTRETPQVIDNRVDYVLSQMYDQGLISEAEYQNAMQEDLNVLESSTASSDAMYDNAYYVEYAIYDVVTKMLSVEGLDDTSANRSSMESRLRNGGYMIYTSLDPDVQSAVQQTVTEWSSYPQMRYSNDASTQSSLGGGEYMTVIQPQVSAAVVNWHTGALVAIVGGRNEPTQKKQLNRAYQMDMPVGSAITPLSVYGPAFDLGASPGTPVLNLPIEIKDWPNTKGYPANYSTSYCGVESIRQAINKGDNVPAAHLLMENVTIENSVTYLLKLGISADNIMATCGGLGLGSSGISVIELANAYAAIANGGTYQDCYAFTQVLNPDGTVYIDVNETQQSRRVFQESTAWLLIDCMEDMCSTTGTCASAAVPGITTAGMPGTTTNNIGCTFAGMTGYYSAAVWIGSDNYKPLVTTATGANSAAPLWSAIMERVHTLTGCVTDRSIMSGSAADYDLYMATTCAVSGQLTTSACEHDANGYGVTTDYYTVDNLPTSYCTMHRAVTICTRTGMIASAYCPSTQVIGVIYIPENHPLRNASSMDTVRSYFTGASTSADAVGLGTCVSCRDGVY